MSNLFVSTIWRGVPWQDSGIVWNIDLDTYEVVDKFFINRDPSVIQPTVENSGHRSVRGMCFWKGSFWVAGYNFIAKVNSDKLEIKDVWFSDECTDIHNIYAEEEHIKITSTYNNSVFSFDGSTFEKMLDLTQVFLNDNTLPDTLHLNSLLDDYALLCTYDSSKSAIVNIKTNQVVFTSDDFIFAHDIQRIGTGELVTNSSGTSKLLAVNTEDKSFRVLFDYKAYNPGDDSVLSKWGWIRGLCYDSDKDMLYVGAPPATVFVFSNVSTDMKLERFIKLYTHVDLHIHVDLSVFDIVMN